MDVRSGIEVSLLSQLGEALRSCLAPLFACVRLSTVVFNMTNKSSSAGVKFPRQRIKSISADPSLSLSLLFSEEETVGVSSALPSPDTETARGTVAGREADKESPLASEIDRVRGTSGTERGSSLDGVNAGLIKGKGACCVCVRV